MMAPLVLHECMLPLLLVNKSLNDHHDWAGTICRLTWILDSALNYLIKFTYQVLLPFGCKHVQCGFTFGETREVDEGRSHPTEDQRKPTNSRSLTASTGHVVAQVERAFEVHCSPFTLAPLSSWFDRVTGPRLLKICSAALQLFATCLFFLHSDF